ncbi:MAG: hypothetical protein K1X91_05630 [Bacteriodetes bacterium]|nr:hypothetical protein [Bacteroidota bacterium]
MNTLFPKHYILALLLFMLIQPELLGGESTNWELLNPTLPVNSIKSIIGVSKDTAFIFGQVGLAYKTVDGGTSWKKLFSVNSQVPFSYDKVLFSSNIEHFLLANNRYLLRVRKDSIYQVFKFDSSQQIIGVQALPSGAWIAYGAKVAGSRTSTLILRSEDQGTSWRTIQQDSIGEVRAVHFFSDAVGVLSNYNSDSINCSLVYTLDSGKTYQRSSTEQYVSIVNNIYYVVLGKLFATDGTRIHTSIDSGKHWTSIRSPHKKAVFDNVYGTVLGAPLVSGYTSKTPHFLISSDIGQNWNENFLPSGANDYGLTEWTDFSIAGDKTVWLVNNRGGIFKKLNSQNQWQRCNSTTENLRKCTVTDDSTIFASGWGSSIQKSIDNGRTWQQLKLIDTTIIQTCHGFTSSTVGFITETRLKQPTSNEYQTTVLFTENGGSTWNTVPIPESLRNRYVWNCEIFSNGLGFIVTRTNAEWNWFRTTNSGKSWIEDNNLNEISATCITKGFDGVFYISTTQGSVYIFDGELLSLKFLSQPTNGLLLGISCAGSTNINICGLNKVAFQSIDRGNTWYNLSDTNKISNASFYNISQAYNGTLYANDESSLWQREVNGTNWKRIVFPGEKYGSVIVKDLELVKNQLLLCGDKGLIIKSDLNQTSTSLYLDQNTTSSPIFFSSNNTFSITTAMPIKDVWLFSILGKRLHEWHNVETNNILELPTLVDGLYFVCYYSEHRFYSQPYMVVKK